MDVKAIANSVKKYAPLLGSVVGGPAGGAVGAGVSGLISIIGSAFGLTDEQVKADPMALPAAIEANPEARIKLMEIETNHRVRLEELRIEQDRLYLADRQGARDADVKKTQATGDRDGNLYALAWVVVAGFFALIMVLLFRKMPQGSSEAIYMLFGALIAGFKDVLGFFFGSSKSSADKTKLMAPK